MKKLGSRMKLWHVTDRGSRQKGPAMTPILKADSLELGTGNMDLDGLRVKALSSRISHSINGAHIGVFANSCHAQFSNITIKIPE